MSILDPVDGLLLAVDGGNSKTDVLVAENSGRVLARVRGPSCAPIHHGLEGAMDALDRLVRRALVEATPTGPARPAVGVFALAGADLPFEEEQLLDACRRRGWVERAVVRNDAFALLRTGTDRGWGVAVVCGAGINGVGVGPDGAVVRFPALGAISGDWGGGYDVGFAALAASVRAQDGRGRPTLLATSVPAYFGLPDPLAVSVALHLGELPEDRLVELPPLVFDAARQGDEAAVEVVLRLADEVTTLAAAAIRRLGIGGEDPDVVLGGGLLRAGLPLLDDAVRAGIEREAPRATVVTVSADPIVGAGLLALDEAGVPAEALARLRAALPGTSHAVAAAGPG
ncbi:MAG TPA: BadF/BadG/BcrA/BcrD ATPase family protein [Kineosporiaceae bacterium]|nr:BadF/BadG/BcrA/BcrD ATPase family protein [Kineosporiaceae bacterium]